MMRERKKHWVKTGGMMRKIGECLETVKGRKINETKRRKENQ